MRLLSYIRTAFLLGPTSLGRALSYRMGLRLGLNPVKRLTGKPTSGPYFFSPDQKEAHLVPPHQWRHSTLAFGHISIPIEFAPPDWHTNLLNGERIADPLRPWWEIPDFDQTIGDIKGVWELSRFDWVLAFSQQALCGETSALSRLNHWLSDWCKENPPYKGANWKCGQEASIRVMHLAMASLILRQSKAAEKNLLALVHLHLQRIAPTLKYAIAQNNNHGTSEAAALFIGGSWLRLCEYAESTHWEELGRKWLENRAKQLIEEDGSFSQYSTNYHRVMLDTYSMVDIWRRQWNLEPFSSELSKRVGAATQWLFCMTNPLNGDAPNIGANDGARLLPLTATDYRDYRPSIYLASMLYGSHALYPPEEDSLDQLRWVGLHLEKDQQTPPASPSSKIFKNGGYAVLKNSKASLVLKFPAFRFRPSHSDGLHLDFWIDGDNLLRDGGTYSYNTELPWSVYFPGTSSHNTVQFDNRDQMPRLSRFLFADWLRGRILQDFQSTPYPTFCVQYRDSQGAQHSRRVELLRNKLTVTDSIAGLKDNAILRWRLHPNKRWTLAGNTVTDGAHCLHVSSTAKIKRLELIHGWESRYYAQKTTLPTLELEVIENCEITTNYSW